MSRHGIFARANRQIAYARGSIMRANRAREIGALGDFAPPCYLRIRYFPPRGIRSPSKFHGESSASKMSHHESRVTPISVRFIPRRCWKRKRVICNQRFATSAPSREGLRDVPEVARFLSCRLLRLFGAYVIDIYFAAINLQFFSTFILIRFQRAIRRETFITIKYKYPNDEIEILMWSLCMLAFSLYSVLLLVPDSFEDFSTHADANAFDIPWGSASQPRFNTVRLTNVRVFLFLTLVINLPTWTKKFAHERTVIVRIHDASYVLLCERAFYSFNAFIELGAPLKKPLAGVITDRNAVTVVVLCILF